VTDIRAWLALHQTQLVVGPTDLRNAGLEDRSDPVPAQLVVQADGQRQPPVHQAAVARHVDEDVGFDLMPCPRNVFRNMSRNMSSLRLFTGRGTIFGSRLNLRILAPWTYLP